MVITTQVCLLYIDVPIGPARKISLTVSDRDMQLHDEDGQTPGCGGEHYDFTPRGDWMAKHFHHVGQMPFLDAITAAVIHVRAHNRRNAIGRHLEPAVTALRAAQHAAEQHHGANP